MYFILAISILGVSKTSPIERTFAQLARQANIVQANRESSLIRLAEMYVKKGVTQDELSILHNKLKERYRQKKYRECAGIGTEMAKLLPRSSEDYFFGLNSVEISTKKPEKSPPKDIPTMHGTFLLALWMTGVGDMLAFDNDYAGALKTYELIRAFKTAPEKGEFPSPSNGTDRAVYGGALMHTILGHRAEALKHIREAPDTDPSWCGTCQWGRERSADILRVVYDAATLPGAKAEVALTLILDSGYKPKKPESDNPPSHEENLEIKVNAAFLLGEIYLRRGETKLASVAFRSIAGYKCSDLAIMAESRLRKLGVPNGKS